MERDLARLAGQRADQRGGRAASTRSPPTRRCSSCATCSPTAGSRSGGPNDGRGVIWHDVEHGSYDADLPLWRQLADATGGPVLDLGAGTGRVSVDLAAQGHDVVALDSDPELLAELVRAGAVGEHGARRRARVQRRRPVPAGHRTDVSSCRSSADTAAGSPCFGACTRSSPPAASSPPPFPIPATPCRRSSSLRRFPTSSSATAGCSRASPSPCTSRMGAWSSSAGDRLSPPRGHRRRRTCGLRWAC